MNICKKLIVYSFIIYVGIGYGWGMDEADVRGTTTVARIVKHDQHLTVFAAEGYPGVSLMVETADERRDILFSAYLNFAPGKDTTYILGRNLTCIPGSLRLEYLINSRYKTYLERNERQQERSWGVEEEYPIKLGDIGDIPAPFVMAESSNIYRETAAVHPVSKRKLWLKKSIFEFTLDKPLTLSALINKAENFTTEDSLQPLYTTAGFCYLKDAINCNGFALRFLKELGIETEKNQALATYLDHNYSKGVHGFFSSFLSVRWMWPQSLDIDRLFNNLLNPWTQGPTIPGMKVVKFRKDEEFVYGDYVGNTAGLNVKLDNYIGADQEKEVKYNLDDIIPLDFKNLGRLDYDH